MLKYLILHYLIKCNYHHARNTQNNIRHAPIKKRRIPITVQILALLTNPLVTLVPRVKLFNHHFSPNCLDRVTNETGHRGASPR